MQVHRWHKGKLKLIKSERKLGLNAVLSGTEDDVYNLKKGISKILHKNRINTQFYA